MNLFASLACFSVALLVGLLRPEKRTAQFACLTFLGNAASLLTRPLAALYASLDPVGRLVFGGLQLTDPLHAATGFLPAHPCKRRQRPGVGIAHFGDDADRIAHLTGVHGGAEQTNGRQQPLMDRPIGGLGVLFVQKLTDEHVYERRGEWNRVTLRRAIGKTRNRIQKKPRNPKPRKRTLAKTRKRM